MAAFETVGVLVSDAAELLGLGPIGNVYASTDPNVAQLRQLLKTVGRRLVERCAFLQSVKEHTLVTTADTNAYPLPADFLSLVDGSGHNRTLIQEMRPVAAREWQGMKARQALPLWQTAFRVRESTLELWPQPPVSGTTLAFEYRSRFWVRTEGQAAPDKDAPSANGDVVHLEAELVKAALRWGFKRLKGFDSTAEQEDFREAFASASERAVGSAPVLRLGGSATGDRLLDNSNAPVSGVGFDAVGLF